jgi:hypothetical protein
MLDIAPHAPASLSGSARYALRRPRWAELHAKHELASVSHSLPCTSRPCKSLLSPSGHCVGVLPYALFATTFVHRHRPTSLFIVRPQHGACSSEASAKTPQPLVEMLPYFSEQLPSLRSRWRGRPVHLPVRAGFDLRGHQGTSGHTRESSLPWPAKWQGSRQHSLVRWHSKGAFAATNLLGQESTVLCLDQVI